MSKAASIDRKLFEELNQDIKKTRYYGGIFITSAILLQVIPFIVTLLSGFVFMIYLTGIVLSVAGILFLIGTSTIPKTRMGVVDRLQKITMSKDPKRRLWAAQRLVGYMKDGEFSGEDTLEITRRTVQIIKNPPVQDKFKPYIAVDQIVILREIAVSVKMKKSTRKEFSKIIKPLLKVKGLPDEAFELLSDAVGYNPKKLPVQAYVDYKKQNE